MNPEIEEAKTLLRYAYPHIEDLMRLARDETNKYYKWVPDWLRRARRFIEQGNNGCSSRRELMNHHGGDNETHRSQTDGR